MLHASHRAQVRESSAARLRVRLDGPQGTRGTLRVYRAGMSLAGVEATDAAGQKVEVETRTEGRTLRIRYPQLSDGLDLVLRWTRG